MKKRTYPLSKVYGLLETGPVVLMTTAYRGQTNVMTMSWKMMVDFEPPLVACVVSNRNHSFEMLRKSRECVLNIPTVEIAKQTVACGNHSGRRLKNKIESLGLTAEPAKTVGAPLIAECYASLECRVVDTSLVKKYGLFFLEVTKAWVAPQKKWPATLHHCGRGQFIVAEKTIRLRSKAS